MTRDSDSRMTGRDVKQARGEARQSGGATSAASPGGNMTSPADAKVELVANLLWSNLDLNGHTLDGVKRTASKIVAALEASADTPTETKPEGCSCETYPHTCHAAPVQDDEWDRHVSILRAWGSPTSVWAADALERLRAPTADHSLVEALSLLDTHIQRCRDAVAECRKWSPAQAEWSRARDALLNYRDAALGKQSADDRG